MQLPVIFRMTEKTPSPKRARLPHYERAKEPPHMRLTDRDRELIAAIHAYDGMLAEYQIQQLFFPDVTDPRYVQDRLSKLFHNGYLAKPDEGRRRQIKWTVYWLGPKGVEMLAGDAGVPVTKFKWRRPYERWGQVDHDVHTNDVHIAVSQAVSGLSEFRLMEWVGEQEFHRHPDQIEFLDNSGEKQKRIIYPDGYFLLGWYKNGAEKPDKLRFLLEFDRGHHSGINFAAEKVRPGIAYLRSLQYKERFGFNAGRWLVVIDTPDSDLRLSFLKERTEATGLSDAKVFFFTTFEAIKRGNILTDRIWQQAGTGQTVALLKT